MNDQVSGNVEKRFERSPEIAFDRRHNSLVPSEALFVCPSQGTNLFQGVVDEGAGLPSSQTEVPCAKRPPGTPSRRESFALHAPWADD